MTQATVVVVSIQLSHRAQISIVYFLDDFRNFVIRMRFGRALVDPDYWLGIMENLLIMCMSRKNEANEK